jgi:hypothetical protein
MSKSYGNTIALFEEEKPFRKKIMGIVTDSTPVEEPKKPRRLYHRRSVSALCFGGRSGADGGGISRRGQRLRRIQEAAIRRHLGALCAYARKSARSSPAIRHMSTLCSRRERNAQGKSP